VKQGNSRRTRFLQLGVVELVALLGVLASPAQAGPPVLPIPCAGSVCVPAGTTTAVPFLGSGTASAVAVGPKLTVTQGSSSALLNWQSFNIGSGATVQFVQPGSSSVALNRIVLANPATIFGALNANGQIFLIDPNGIIFGSTSKVSVGSLVASTLDVPASQLQLVLTNGITAPLNNGQPAFSGSSANGSIAVEQGASIQTPQGGTILMFAPAVTNEGTLEAPGGQVMLAAGTSVYLASSSDPTLRGLLVEVSGNGTVTNGDAADANAASPQQLVGQIISNEGNVTLAGLAVNQDGLISATTSVRENGSIVLQARTGSIGTVQPPAANVAAAPNSAFFLEPGTGGTLTLGPKSLTAVTLDTSSTETTVDSVPQPKSDVKMFATNVQIESGATVTATSGAIDVVAELDQSQYPVGETSQSDGSVIYIAPNATLDVSGATVTLPASSIVVPVELRGTELADFPLQRNGPLRSETVYVNSLLYGTRSDGSTWVGTPLADVSGEIGAIPRNVVERNLTGGTVSLQSQGDVVVANGATINISGGATHYTAGYLDTTELVTTTGQLVNISEANPDLLYEGIAATTTTVSDPKWGVTNTYAMSGVGSSTNYQPAFTEGADAGTVVLVTPRFVLDGTINGSVTVGQYQRSPAITNPAEWPENLVASEDAGAPQSVELYRPYDEQPVAGTLIIGDPSTGVTGLSGGPEYVQGSVTFGSETVLPSLTAGGAFNPATEQLPASYTSSVLRPGLFGPDGVGNLQIYSDGMVSIPAGVHVGLTTGGSLAITANSINVQGSIDAPGGDITMAAEPTASSPQLPDAAQLPSVVLGPDAQLTARGNWVNDSAMLNPNGPSGPVFLSGGTVSLSAEGDVTLEPGSLIDVSGGAQLTSTGTMTYGSGGTIALGVTPYAVANGDVVTEFVPTTLDSAGTLRAYGAESGGTLKLTADTVCIASSNCSGGDPSVLWLAPGFFQKNGFANYDIASSSGGITVAPGTVIDLIQQNLVAATSLEDVPSAAAFEPLASPVVLPALVRQPTSLSLAAEISTAGIPQSASQVAQAPSLLIGAGAVISTDPQGEISLASDTRIIDDGTIVAPDGAVSLTLNSNLPVYAFAPTQGIWLAPGAVIDAAGVAEITPNDIGISTGQVLPGGTVTLTADRGYIEMLPGSLIDVRGTSADITQWQVVDGALQAVPTVVGSAGGSVTLSAAAGMSLDGSFEAEAGEGASRTPAGGALTVALNPANIQYSTPGSYPQAGSLAIVLGESAAPVVVAPGSAVPQAVYGEALISASTLNSSGFDNESFDAGLVSASVVPGGVTENGFSAGGVLSVAQNVTVQTGDSIQVDVAAIQLGLGATATFSAPYVSIGNSDNQVATDFQSFQSPSTGTGTLRVTGTQLLDLYGTFALDGVASAQFATDGDLRLIGVLQPSPSSPTPTNPVGELLSAGNIELQAAQVYPTTLTAFTVASTAANGVIDVEKSGGSAQPDSVWSAGGTLILSAATIDQNGNLRAPFGTITLEGPQTDVNSGTITLGPGSLTSTSANGLTIPFGTTQGGFDWTYPLPDGTTFVYGTDGIAPPAQQINLVGNQINIESGSNGQKGATIDVAGGGNLMAYEFEPDTTTGGNTDILAATNGLYAIVPSINTIAAPYDPNISNGSTLQLGESVYLAGAPGLPAGTYTLLPARYALLPGAFLVSPAGSSYNGIAPGEQFPYPGGGTIVAGYYTIAGTSIADSNTSGFAVIPASVFEQEATYTTTLASQFFTSQALTAAQTQGTSVTLPRLPADAGVLTLAATSQLTLNGTLQATPGTGGLGAQVDIASSNIDVVASAPGAASAAPGANIVTLPVASLEQLGAQSLLLGGEREGSDIETFAQSVTISPGVQLSGPEILLTATGEVDVASGASLDASGSAPPPSNYTLTVPPQVASTGDGAFLSVSTSPIGTVTRVNATAGTGVLDLQAGSVVSAPQGSLYLDAGTVLTSGTLALKGADLAVQSSAITLGSPPSGTSVSGTVLGGAVLDAAALRSLSLVSGTSIAVDSDVTVNAENLSIDGPGLVAGQPGANAVMNASGTLVLSNVQGAAPAAPSATGGVLTLNAQNVQFGAPIPAASAAAGTTPQEVTISGFGSVSVNAQGQISAAVDSSFSGTTGNLTLTAARVTTASDVSLDVSSAGTLSVTAPTEPASVAPASGLGGSLQLVGQSVELATSIDLPAGSVQLVSTGGGPAGSSVVLAPGASIDVAGLARRFNGIIVGAPGGSVSINSAGNVDLASGSTIDVSGTAANDAGSIGIIAPAGSFTSAGALKGAGGGSFSVDANQIVDAEGNADFAGLNQLLNGAGFTGIRSVELGQGNLDVASGMDITASNVQLIADSGNVSVEGTIDASGATGGSVLLAASGNVTLSGTIDAHATGAGQSGGQVELEAGTYTTNAAGQLDYSNTGELQFNPGAMINVSGGPANSYGNLGSGGLVLARVPQSTAEAMATTGGTGIVWQGTVVGANQTVLETVLPQQTAVPGIISQGDQTTAYQNASTWVSTYSQGLMSALDLPNGSALVLEPGLEFDNPAGSLTVSSAWNLYPDRFDGASGILTLRASGGIDVADSISDGFASADPSAALESTNSWSYRLVAGADFSSADVMGIAPLPPSNVSEASAAQPGDVTLESGTMVRTGTGFIDVTASGDLVLSSQTSVLYTAGTVNTANPGVVQTYNGVSLPYPTGGGNIDIAVEGNVEGIPSNQLFTAWLWRVGGAGVAQVQPGAVAWSVNFQDFQQGVGALGGGNVTVTAGGDITDLSASVPSIGEQTVGTAYNASNPGVDVISGGDLTVEAGGAIYGGNYFVGLGTGRIVAGSDISGAQSATGFGPVLGIGDAQVLVQAQGSIDIGGVVNPTLVPQTSANAGVTHAYTTFFSTYAPDSSLTLLATSGDVTLADNSSALEGLFTSIPVNTWDEGAPGVGPASVSAFNILPPTLTAVATGGSISFSGVLGLFPASRGNLELLAENNIEASPSATGSPDVIILSDADPNLLPSVAQPASGLNLFNYLSAQAQEFSPNPTSGLSETGADAPVPIHIGDTVPVEIVAATGNIDFSAASSATSSAGIISAKPADVIAGGNITDLGLAAQNLAPGDVTVVDAGGSLTYPYARSPGGAIEPNDEDIAVDGPGALEMTVGGSINLGTSAGIVTRGNLVNVALPSEGASVDITVGTGANPANLSSFIATYVDGSDQFDAQVVTYMESLTGDENLTTTQAKQALNQLSSGQQLAFMQYALAPQYAAAIGKYIDGSSTDDAALVAYVEQVTGAVNLSASAAKQAFAALSPQLQDLFVDQVVFTTMNTDATQAVSSGTNNYSGAFAALTTLFPGANPNLAAGQSTPYQGSIDMYFSQIYTLDGGSISLLAPGGDINVGLATPPTAFGITKQPAQLGLVAQGTGDVSALAYGDFEVNESRVFAANGGNILAWSTEGNIDAGRGAKTSISASPPTITIGPNGQPVVTFPAALTGSGIQALATSAGVEPGTVSLFAPHGVVNANDAGITAGNLVIGATAVLGANNITVSGTAIGLPPPTPALGASLAGATSTGSAATAAAEQTLGGTASGQQSQTPAAEAALNFLDVFITGLGEENCRPEDTGCLQREQQKGRRK
jgi:filamentous hemagglutinin